MQPRVELKLREKNHDSDTERGAYRVLTLTIKDLEETDAGVYKCMVNRSSTPGAALEGAPATDSRNLTLTVLQPDEICTIEGEGLCGWRDLADESTGDMIQWRRLDGSDEISRNRSSGRFDHTYGASKDVGHFLDVDRFREQQPEEAIARLQSPVRAPHATSGCFHFWYIYYGNDHEYLQVKVSPVNSTQEEEEIVFHLNNSNTPSVWIGDWVLATVDLPPQAHDYHVVFEVKTCRGRCKKARFIALDDFRFFSESCEVVQKDKATIWSNRDLPVRLVNGSTEYDGRVEILHDAMWGSVCSTQFGNKEAKVICTYLGFKGEGAMGKRKSPDGGADDDVIIWLQRLGCDGTERDLGTCIAKGETWGKTESCSHDKDARVLCGEVAPTPSPTLPTLPIAMLLDKTTSSSTAPTTSTPVPSTQSPSSTQTAQMTTEETHDITTVPPQPSTTIEVTDIPDVKTTPAIMTSSTSGLVTSDQTPTTLPSPTVEPSGGEDMNGTTEVAVLPTTTAHQNVSNTTTDTSHTDSPVESKKSRRNTGAAVGISLTILLLSAIAGVWMYRKRKNRRKSKYIVFSNPKYSREHLPANDISLDSPLTSGSSILA